MEMIYKSKMDLKERPHHILLPVVYVFTYVP